MQVESRFAGVIAHHQDRVVLVREEYPGWGRAFWNIPSGRVQDHESPREGATRELAEETGLLVVAATLSLHSTSEVAEPGRVSRSWNFTVDVEDPTLGVRDPDGLIQEACWFPTDEATHLLRMLPYRPLSEPAIATLTRQAPAGAHWAYPDPKGKPVVTLSGD